MCVSYGVYRQGCWLYMYHMVYMDKHVGGDLKGKFFNKGGLSSHNEEDDDDDQSSPYMMSHSQHPPNG